MEYAEASFVHLVPVPSLSLFLGGWWSAFDCTGFCWFPSFCMRLLLAYRYKGWKDTCNIGFTTDAKLKVLRVGLQWSCVLDLVAWRSCAAAEVFIQLHWQLKILSHTVLVVGVHLYSYVKLYWSQWSSYLCFFNMERVTEVKKCNHIIFCGKASPLRCISVVILFLQQHDRLHQAPVPSILRASKTPDSFWNEVTS